MTREEFNKLVTERMDKIQNTLLEKDKEYTQHNDRMHSFKTTARIDNITPERALHGMMIKHYVSYKDIIDNLDNGVLPSKKLLDAKVTDLINYFILFEGLVLERLGKEK